MDAAASPLTVGPGKGQRRVLDAAARSGPQVVHHRHDVPY
jgi:hypothetical protein